jgi:hypothetical protein
VAELLKVFVDRGNLQFPSLLLRELLSQVENNDTENETEGLRNVCHFIRKLAKHTPRLCYCNIEPLLNLFSRQSHYSRQAILKVLANVVIYYIVPYDFQQETEDANRLLEDEEDIDICQEGRRQL